MDLIVKKSGLSQEEVDTLLALLMENISTVSDEKIKARIEGAMKVMNDIDPKDAPILACALAIPNGGIWTQDKHFDKQNKVKIWNSKDLLKYV